MEKLSKTETLITESWLKSIGFISYGVYLLHPKFPNFHLLFTNEYEEDLGHNIEFYLLLNDDRKLVYSAYYHDKDDFLSEVNVGKS